MGLWRESLELFWTPSIAYALAAVAVVSLIVWFARPADRATLKNTVAFFLFATAGQFAAAGLLVLGSAAAGAALHEAMVVAAGLAVIRLSGLVLFRLIAPLARLHPPRILEDFIVIAGYAAWGLVRLRLAGVDLSGIVATSAVITAIVAFAMQETLGNILGGLALEFDSAFEVGDWIRIDEISGRVVDMRWRSISVETSDWETVVIPNSHLVRSKLTIVGRRQNESTPWRRWVRFDVGLSAPPEKVIAAVEEALRATRIEAVALHPLPDCLLMGFESGFARYAVRYFLVDPAREDLAGASVRDHVLKALQRADIRLAVTEHNIHLTAEDDKHRVEVRQRELARRIAVLEKVELFREFSSAELETVAERLVHAPFAPGDVITRQGAIAHWLYILTRGEVDVVLDISLPSDAKRTAHHGDAAQVAFQKSAGQTATLPQEQRHLVTLKAPDVFGEMGLMTGEPRRSTVVARTAVECFRLDKAAFEGILLAREGLAENMSRILANRQADLDRVVQGLGVEALARANTHRHDEILGRIQRFFGMASG